MNTGRCLLVCLVLLFSSCSEKEDGSTENRVVEEEITTAPHMVYGLPADSFIIDRGSIAPNQYLSTLLSSYGVPYQKIDDLVRNSSDIFDVKKIRPGKNYAVLSGTDSLAHAEYFVYERDAAHYVVFCLGDSCYAYEGEHQVEKKMKTASGVIHSSLYLTMQEQDLSPTLALEMSDIYAWTIDFYRINKGDAFKLIYEELYVDTLQIGTGDILAVLFKHGGEDLYAFRFVQDSIPDYFDEVGESLKKAFLKAPLKFSRISSGFSKKRFHPVLKRYKSHLGTDYAAPTGTPIMAVGDGTVIKSEYKKNNGNYVKIKHNGTYETQYLHMSKRAVKVGDFVRQGQTIGYVGSTGLATGPHVCFRFWKNGQQIDHRKEKFPPSKPIRDALKPKFSEHIKTLKLELDEIVLDHDSTDTSS